MSLYNYITGKSKKKQGGKAEKPLYFGNNKDYNGQKDVMQ
jgi:hypothetical protein